jgi:tetratricopeptide (TPR) repeat protein
MESGVNIPADGSKNCDLNETIDLNEETYNIVTENLSNQNKIVTKIYVRGEVISTAMADYDHFAKFRNLSEKVKGLMENHHKSVRDSFIQERSKPVKTKAEFASEVRKNLKARKKHAALDAAREALKNYPSDPFFLSYCGYLIAEAENNPRTGIVFCEEAINGLKGTLSDDMIFFRPLFYFHLGKAYLKAGKKPAALQAFKDGLSFDPKNRDLLSETKKLGKRKGPVLPFMDRSHPVNIFLGKLRHRFTDKKPQQEIRGVRGKA